ncbi:MAG: BREX-1 system adenine-specific DNA-methyltransferase PglX [Chloroflexi bacterium]|nr:BREX-1 system adenine-specific DNA-methyltransferase PglX [Chloroflexota bacterium]
MKRGEEPPKAFALTDEWGDPDGTGEMWVRPNSELHDLRDIWHYALSVGGYHYAKEYLGLECAELANPRLEKYQQTHKWEGTFEELRCCLFYEQRRWRHFGYDPEGEELTAILDLYRAVCERWDWEVDVVPFREEKDPRKILMLDPAGGSGHFGLYCFDLFETIYAEAYDDPDLGPALQADYPDREAFLGQVPALILADNIHIIDIDSRACQIAALALWLRAQRSFQQMNLRFDVRPQIRIVNVVCAEPMPGERTLLDEFTAELKPRVLADLVRIVFDKMKLAGEAGSLLMIEEELQSAIADAKRQWLKGDPTEQLALFEEFARPQKPEQLALFDLSGITDESFWDQAEAHVLDALRAYAEHATNGRTVRRRLFADDAKQGFAFVDLCRRKYDIVLMNPPFGWSVPTAKKYQEVAYADSKNDLYCAFVQRAVGLAVNRALLGCLTSRTGFFLPSMHLWRENVVLGSGTMRLMADLGFEVLDRAFVETAASVITADRSVDEIITFFRLNESSNKANDLEYLVRSNSGYLVRGSEIRSLPGFPFSYWLSQKVRRLFSTLPSIEDSNIKVAIGLVTSDNERFLRTRWEIPPGNSQWIGYPKGGDYSKFHQDVYLFVNWAREGEEIKAQVAARYGSASRFVQNTSLYGRPGLTYPNISVKGFNVRVLPGGCIFSHVGQGIFSHDIDPWLLLGLLNSEVFEFLLRALTPSRKWDSGFVKAIPMPNPETDLREYITRDAQQLHELVLRRDLGDERTARFTGLGSLNRGSLSAWAADQVGWNRIVEDNFAELYRHLSHSSLAAYDLSIQDIRLPWSSANTADIADNEDSVESELPLADSPYQEVQIFISYAIGLALGRWDVRLSLDDTLAPKLQDPFDLLPVCPPGMLVGTEGLPATPHNIVSGEWLRARPNAITLPPDGAVEYPTIPHSEYPIRIPWDGILIDDPGLDRQVAHPSDIVRRVREVFTVLWGDRADAIEAEACEILGVHDLRDHFHSPSGFFADHVKRYSKSRRQAPIYWALSTASGSYTVWVYYHRLTKDTLYTIVTQYVNPKIESVQKRVDQLDEKLETSSGKTATDLRDQLNDTKQFLSELNVFRAELLRVAELPYKPDLNDGVIINAAPLNKLYRLRKWANDTAAVWKKLEAGEYDWAHMAYNIWPKRVEKKCETDRSIAIAHGLEHLCRAEVKKTKKAIKRKEEDEDEEND